MNKKSGINTTENPAASSGDCTGLIPTGGNHTAEEINIYKEIIPYSAPAKNKGYDKEELEKIKQQNRY